jgi:hypothetical protein
MSTNLPTLETGLLCGAGSCPASSVFNLLARGLDEFGFIANCKMTRQGMALPHLGRLSDIGKGCRHHIRWHHILRSRQQDTEGRSSQFAFY